LIKILAIDDTEDITFSIKKMLENVDKNYQVTVANSGRDGLMLAEQTIPDLIILDIMMPEVNGWVVLKNLKNNLKTKSIPIIFLTAKSDELSLQMGKRAVEDFVVKPVDAATLDKKIKAVLKAKHVGK
jgi:DNA-binding response OmpR family regulator